MIILGACVKRTGLSRESENSQECVSDAPCRDMNVRCRMAARARVRPALRPPPRRGAARRRPVAVGVAALAAGPFGQRLELAHQAARRRVGQGDDPLRRGQGQADHPADQGLAAGQLGDVLDLVRADRPRRRRRPP